MTQKSKLILTAYYQSYKYAKHTADEKHLSHLHFISKLPMFFGYYLRTYLGILKFKNDLHVEFIIRGKKMYAKI